MFALGFKFLRAYNGVTSLAIGYSREYGTQQPLFVINFGSANVSRQAEHSSLREVMIPNVARFTGLGYGDEECTTAGMLPYRIEVPRQWMLCTDFIGVHLFQHANLSPNNEANFIIDLSDAREEHSFKKHFNKYLCYSFSCSFAIALTCHTNLHSNCK